MRSKAFTSFRGFTMIELLVTMGISMFLVGLALTSFISFSRREAMEAGASAIAGALRDARAQTLASVGGTQYGIYIEEKGFIFFEGSSYVPGKAGNDEFPLNAYVKLSSSAPSFVFQRITGNASASGTIDIYLASDPTTKRTITVGSTGLVSIQ